MLDWCGVAIAVEWQPHIRQRHVNDASRPKHSLELEKTPNRVLEVLQKVVGDDEVESAVAEGG